MAERKNDDRIVNLSALKIFYINILCTILVVTATLAGLSLIQQGTERLLTSRGEDIARINEFQVGELDIVSTREVVVRYDRVLQMIVGVVMIAVCLYAVHRIQGYFNQRVARS